MRAELEKRGVTLIDRVAVTELLTSDGLYPTAGSIVGAVGFDARTGEFGLLRAGATIIATGPVNTKSTGIADSVTGDGVAMTARAGASMVDMEWGFGGTFTTMMKRYKFPAFNVAVGHGARLINSKGERFMEQYDPERLERSELPRVVAAFLNELLEGRGPVSLDLRHCDDNFFDDLTQVKGKNAAAVLLSGKVPDPREHPIPIEPGWTIWSHRCGVKIDLNCATTLPGLFSAGSMVKNKVTGTHASAGIPTAFCGVSGYRAGQAAVAWARRSAPVDPPAEALRRLQQEALGPLSRHGDSPSADDLFDGLGEVISNPLQTMVMSETSIRQTLDTLNALRSLWDGARAVDAHDLVKAHEVRNAIECAQLIYISALDRTESRESFFREDFPDTDNEEWFCWHNIRRTPQGYAFSRVPIPRGPELAAMPSRKKSPIAAIMDHDYRPEDFD
jgi:succinate dehydrogenase/fumarate reductase flavoprotein subunit